MALLGSGLEVGPDGHERFGVRLTAEVSADLEVELGHAQASLGFVVVESDPGIDEVLTGAQARR